MTFLAQFGINIKALVIFFKGYEQIARARNFVCA